MSTHEHYEFLAVDRLLSSAQQDELANLSSRAEISPTRFRVTYNYGSFRGEPVEILADHFDVFVYLSN